MKLIDDYEKALQAIYDHVGFKEDWVIYPISDETNMYWKIGNETVYYGETPEDVTGETDDSYSGSIYTQRFYEKWVYRGADFTMIFLDTQVDGMKYFSIFDNAKEIV